MNTAPIHRLVRLIFVIVLLLPIAGQAQLAPPQYVGCFKDTITYDLNGYLERSRTNTPQRCVQICAAKGFAFAGVQYSESCLCGNSYGRYGAATNCDMRCTGDPQQVCGGYASNSVYRTGVTPPAPKPPVAAVPPPTIVAAPTPSSRYVGCFKDTVTYDLNGYLERSGANTPQRCVQTCAAKGFPFAGVQYGESCLCGNSYGRYEAANNCDMRCTGNGSQVCGGYASNAVYSTGAATSPTAPKAPPAPTAPAPPTQPAPAGNWTAWFNRDDAGGSGDWEILSEVAGSIPCTAPVAIECRVVSDKRDWKQAGQRYRCSLEPPNAGGVCLNADNPTGCLNYEVRFLCPNR